MKLAHRAERSVRREAGVDELWRSNAYIERFVQAIGQECLDKLIVFGREHFDHVMAEYVACYHTERSHKGRGNAPLMAAGAQSTDGEVVSRERLGGLLRHHYREAA